MSRTTLHPVLRGLYLLFRSPERFEQFAAEEGARQATPDPAHKLARAARDIRRAQAESFGLVVLTVAVGWVMGEGLESFVGPSSAVVNHVLQYTGVGVFLCATLAMQGWNLETFDGNSLPERLNRAIYRGWYLVGSLLLVLSVAWPQRR